MFFLVFEINQLTTFETTPNLRQTIPWTRKEHIQLHKKLTNFYFQAVCKLWRGVQFLQFNINLLLNYRSLRSNKI